MEEGGRGFVEGVFGRLFGGARKQEETESERTARRNFEVGGLSGRTTGAQRTPRGEGVPYKYGAGPANLAVEANRAMRALSDKNAMELEKARGK